MTLSKAEALALAEFAGIEVMNPDRIPYAKHNEPELWMSLSRYLLTAEGALRVLSAKEMNYDVLHHDWHSNKRYWGIFNGESPAEAIITAALKLPTMQELVKKYQGESNE